MLAPIAASSKDKTQTFELDMSGITYEKPNLWKGGFNKTHWEILIGYVNKSWVCDYGNGTQREDYFGDPDTKFIHGVQMGALFTPSFDWGLGLRTGLLLEVYESRSRYLSDWCDKFSEGNLNIPLHASFRIPFNDISCLNFYGGLGFQWVLQGRYENYVYNPYSLRRPIRVETVDTPEYGNGWPKRINYQAELGLNVRYGVFGLNFSYAFGLVNQEIENSFDEGQTFIKALHSRQDKMQATIMISF